MKYLAVFQQVGNVYSAYVPDVPYCVAADTDLEKVKASIREGLQLALRSLMPDRAPQPTAFTVELEVEMNGYA